MGHSIGDGIIVLAAAAAFIGYFYFRHREKLRRFEILHQERLTAMDKGIPLPELPIDPPRTKDPLAEDVPLIMGIVFLAFGVGTMIALYTLTSSPAHQYRIMPLPLAMVGLGLMLYHFLASSRKR